MSCTTDRPQTMLPRLIALMRKRWVTPLIALQSVGCLSLSQRAGELERAGHHIERKWVRLDNGKRVMSYRINSMTQRDSVSRGEA